MIISVTVTLIVLSKCCLNTRHEEIKCQDKRRLLLFVSVQYWALFYSAHSKIQNMPGKKNDKYKDSRINNDRFWVFGKYYQNMNLMVYKRDIQNGLHFTLVIFKWETVKKILAKCHMKSHILHVSRYSCRSK